MYNIQINSVTLLRRIHSWLFYWALVNYDTKSALNFQVQLQDINNQIKHRQHLEISSLLLFRLYIFIRLVNDIQFIDLYLVGIFVDAFLAIQRDFFDDYLFEHFSADLLPNQPEFEQAKEYKNKSNTLLQLLFLFRIVHISLEPYLNRGWKYAFRETTRKLP